MEQKQDPSIAECKLQDKGLKMSFLGPWLWGNSVQGQEGGGFCPL